MNVLLVDDQPLMQIALQSVLGSLEDAARIIGVETLDRARRIFAEGQHIDVVMLGMPVRNAAVQQWMQELRASDSQVPLVVLVSEEQPSDIVRSLDAGAMGVVNKRSSPREFLDAMRMVMSGGVYLSAVMTATLAERAAQVAAAPSPTEESPPFPADAAAVADNWQSALSSLCLTPRQNEVLMLLLHGKSNKVIARELNLSVETVKDHVAAVLRTLKVSTRTQAVLEVQRLQQRGRRAA